MTLGELKQRIKDIEIDHPEVTDESVLMMYAQGLTYDIEVEAVEVERGKLVVYG